MWGIRMNAILHEFKCKYQQVIGEWVIYTILLYYSYRSCYEKVIVMQNSDIEDTFIKQTITYYT